MQADWQTLATCAIGLAASVYLARRWWPAAERLLGRKGAADAASASACGTAASPLSTGQNGVPACGNGCGQCGQGATPRKDHRGAQPVKWLDRTPH